MRICMKNEGDTHTKLVEASPDLLGPTGPARIAKVYKHALWCDGKTSSPFSSLVKVGQVMSGFLAVLSDPGQQATLEEFHDWYNNEHIPLRLHHLKSFLSGARYAAADGKQPGWLAMYEVESVSAFQDPSYTILREKRSDRERELIQRLGVLDRRTCEVVYDSGKDNAKGTGMNVGNPSTFVVTVEIPTRPEESTFNNWVQRLSSVEQWARIRVVKALDKAITAVDESLKRVDVLDYLAVIEFVSKPGHVDQATIDAWLASYTDKTGQWRVWDLYKAYPCVGNGDDFKTHL
ncbi:hypothetical protein CC1G_07291 [Coprinopsis cinerea okayama7|uniref:Uncharacterized protein n=1 Tax=Coprinopsis cinerea (strain Okayama-7 / 130 / ATCC MYA-4618 / FGSC 9003) TaxID=240176 RepID=A8NNL1_COPC7|nr:hypothetical protein CC1G_07291 [Coprinopsis cinerea okayama7\|eukprot:XP_001835149.1 hypothetical protein CC1G_07291 [Coprinopsis cinerea okayama7\